MKMHRFLGYMLIAAAVTLFGCESQEQKPPQEQSHQVVKPEEAKSPVTAQATPVPAETASQAAEQVIPNSEKIAEEAKEVVDKSAAAASSAAKEVATTAQKVVEPLEEKAEGLVAEAKKEVVQTTTAVEQPVIPEQIVLAASYGNVTFPHKVHAESFECSTCHGEGVPAAFGINKEIAHKLCKGCHAENGAGPTGCKGCHVK